jgi:hypothetical protein
MLRPECLVAIRPDAEHTPRPQWSDSSAGLEFDSDVVDRSCAGVFDDRCSAVPIEVDLDRGGIRPPTIDQLDPEGDPGDSECSDSDRDRDPIRQLIRHLPHRLITTRTGPSSPW